MCLEEYREESGLGKYFEIFAGISRQNVGGMLMYIMRANWPVIYFRSRNGSLHFLTWWKPFPCRVGCALFLGGILCTFHILQRSHPVRVFTDIQLCE